MRNLIKADLRRVFRKQIYWIIPAVILIMNYQIFLIIKPMTQRLNQLLIVMIVEQYI